MLWLNFSFMIGCRPPIKYALNIHTPLNKYYRSWCFQYYKSSVDFLINSSTVIDNLISFVQSYYFRTTFSQIERERERAG